MRSWRSVAPLFVLACSADAQLTDEERSFDGSKVVRVWAQDLSGVHLMSSLSGDCWSHTPGVAGELDWLVAPEAMEALRESGIRHEVVIQDVGRLISDERARLASPRAPRAWFDEYKTRQEISDYADGLVALRPDIIRRENIGTSLQGRMIYALRMTSPEAGGFAGRKPIILLNGLQHAREWISPMTTMFIVDRLVRGYATGWADAPMLDDYEIIIIPVTNPDGYEYTWSTNRLWRKNRRANPGGSFGIDLNRNWSFQWGLNNGSSPTPTNDTYRGPSPFSEPETTSVAAFARSLRGVAAHWDVHSYGQLILSAWSYAGIPSPAAGEYARLNERLRIAFASASGSAYRSGQAFQTLYPMSGSAQDWFYGDRNAFSWTIELRDTGANGFVLPPAQIVPTGGETYAALRMLTQELCLADFDRDGSVDFFDYAAFTEEFESGNAGADFDRDGSIDFFDYDAFVGVFERGC